MLEHRSLCKYLRFLHKNWCVYSHLNEYMKISEYKRSMLFFDQCISYFSIFKYLLRSHWANYNTLSYRASRVGKTKLCSDGPCCMINMASSPIYNMNFKNLFHQNQLTNSFETWYVASDTIIDTKIIQMIAFSCPCPFFTARSVFFYGHFIWENTRT